MNYELVELEEMYVVGKSILTTNQDGKATRDIGQAWSFYMANGLYQETKNKMDTKTLGVYYDYESDATAPYRFMTGCKVSENENLDMETIKIPKAKYAKFTVNGHIMEEVAKAWAAIWSIDLKRTYTFDIEIYHNNGADPMHQQVDIYIAIE
jgi:predicted transcriptional regulator YdeE